MQNFIQIGQKTQKLEIFTFRRFWLVGLVGQKMAVASFYVVSDKTTEVEDFYFWSILVGQAGRSKNGCSHFKNSDPTSLPNFNQIG